MKIGLIHHENSIKELVRLLISKQTHHEVIWSTNFGPHALDLAKNSPPDLVLLDARVVEWDGVGFIGDLIAQSHSPILLLTPNIDIDSSLVFEAMAHGVLDVAPDLKDTGPKEELRLLEKIRQMALLVPKESVVKPLHEMAVSKTSKSPTPLVVIGASTGGPLAIASILSSFPRNIEASIVIVQHVDNKFCSGLAEWLGKRSHLSVNLVSEETAPVLGNVYLSDSNWHLVMNRYGRLTYTSKSNDNIYKPSIDLFFESVAKNWKTPSVAVLLTGMGSDGAHGLKKLKDKGWITIAEDESSCAVYGMPKAAIEIGAACEVLSLQNIPLAILKHLKRKKSQEVL